MDYSNIFTSMQAEVTLIAVIVLLFLGYFEWRQELFDVTTFWYLYLTTFIAFMLYADSIRFKSLM